MTSAPTPEELFPRLASPDRAPAITVAGRTLSYAELAEAAREHQRRHRIRAGERIGVWAEPTLETVIALVGTARSGAVTVPLNPKLGPREREHLLNDSRPRVLGGVPERELGPVEPVEEAEDPLLILYTSGTTGPPKGAVLTRRNVTANLDALASVWELSARDRLIHALPLFHAHGLVLGLFGALRAGAHLHFHPRFSPEAIAAALALGQTVLYAVPTMYHRLADAAETDRSIRDALAAARLLVSGSAALPEREHRRLGVNIYERYGLSETLMNCAVRKDGPPLPGLVGPPLPGVEVKLVDDARRTIDGEGAMGEIAVRGPNVFAGYLGRPEATAAARDEDGWFTTGDLARREKGGAYRILGRRSTDLIKTGGFKVGAGEVEACLLEADGVAEAAVIGVPDDDLGEAIVAFVVPRSPASPPRPADLIQWVADRLTPHKRPRRIELADALPRNALGKVQKHRLS